MLVELPREKKSVSCRKVSFTSQATAVREAGASLVNDNAQYFRF
jgi:hypothetical protein